MTGPTNNRVRRQRQVETAIRIVAPVLDLLLALADRASRVLYREDPDYVTARMAREGDCAPRGLRDHPLADH